MKHRKHILKTCVLLFLFVCASAASSVFAQGNPRVYIEAQATMDSAATDMFSSKDSESKAGQVDFGSAISAALVMKKVPVMVVTDESKAQWVIKSISSQKEDNTVVKATKIVTGGGLFGGGFTKFEGTIQVVDIESTGVLFAYNVKKGNFQSAAEAFAKHFNNYLKRRR